MANRIFYPYMAIGQRRIMLGGAFFPAGTGPVTTSDGVTPPRHAGFDVARTGVGTFTLTLQDVYPAVLGVNVSLILQVPQNIAAQVNVIPIPGVVTANAFVITTFNQTTLAAVDIPQLLPTASGSGNLIAFDAVMKNSNIGAGV